MANTTLRACLAIALAACVAALGAGGAHASAWTPFGPADGGRAVGTHPTVAGQAMVSQWSEVSTWFTADGGAHWSGSPWRNVNYRPVLAGTPTVAWMVNYSQLLRSTDQGRSWYRDGPPELMNAAVFVAVNPGDVREIVLIGTEDVAHTKDSGASWTIDPTPGIVHQATVDWTTRRVYVCLLNEAGEPHPPASRRLLDTPGSWTSVGPGARYAGAGSGVLLVRDVDGALHRSTNHGASFSPAIAPAGPLEISDIAFSPSTPARVYAFDNAYPFTRILRSDDGGATWVPKATLTTAYLFESHVAVDAANGDRLYAATGDGVLESLDGGATFHELSRAAGAPARSRYIAVDAVDPARLWSYHPEAYERLARRSVDGGVTWTPIGDVRLWGASRQRTNTVFGASFSGVGFIVSEDGGITWSTTLSQPPSIQYFGPFAHGSSPGQVLLAGWGYDLANARVDAVFVSTDDGRTFAQRASPPIQVFTMAASASGTPAIYAGGFALDGGGPQLWRSTDNALSWQPVANFPHPWQPGPTTGNTVMGITVDPTDPQRLYVGLALPHHLMKSMDGGATWSRATVGLGSGAVVSIVVDPAQPTTLYAAEHSSGVFRSTDRGETWTALDQGLRDTSLRQLLLDPHHPGRLYAGTDSGLFKVELGTGLPAGHRRAVEFYHPAFDHYVVSADLDEVAGLDAGVFSGWLRTGEGFRVAEGAAPGNQPVCRFFGTGFAPKSSHFYTPYPAECVTVKADPNWFYEKIAFGLALPDPVSRGCPPDTRPLYRAWNRNMGGAPNHRYNTDWQSIELSVLRQGWVLEGDAATNVFACVPVE